MKIGFIGCGNMATALIEGFLSSGIIEEKNIFISDKDGNKLSRFKERKMNVSVNNEDVINFSDIVFFAVKPNVLSLVIEEIGERNDEKTYVSIAAGFTIEKMEKHLGSNSKIVRVMPNTPALVKCGMSVFSTNKNITDEEKRIVKKLLSSVGEVIELEERFINASTAIHGSSPAYIYMMIDAMSEAGVRYGISKKDAVLLAAKAVEGSAKMVLSSNEPIKKLIENVCSPGGTTIEAVNELEKNGFKPGIQSAIDKCVEKAEKL